MLAAISIILPVYSPFQRDVQTHHDGNGGDQFVVGQGTRVLDYNASCCDLGMFGPCMADDTFTLRLSPPHHTCACVVSTLPLRANPVLATVLRFAPTDRVFRYFCASSSVGLCAHRYFRAVFWPPPPMLSCCTVLQVPVAAVEWMAEEMPACTLSVKMGG